ncbi:MAG: DUF4476 domain-containing protein [Flavobacteriales bacterium]|nr:DUF4476 domain-containing protein [Flavobacteriales bacterium]
MRNLHSSNSIYNHQHLAMRFLILLLTTSLSLSAVAQQVSHATFYSKEGYLFTIFLNGQKMNDTPQTEVRLINLTQPYYSCEAVFEDPSLEPAVRKLLQLTDSHGSRVDATFVVEHSKKGPMKIGWKSHSLYPRYIEEDNTPTVVVVGGGAPGTMQQTTTTRTVGTTVQDGVSMSFGGLGGSVNINTGTSQPIVEETTTVTTMQGTGTASGGDLPCGGTILGNQDFEMALKSITVRSSEEGRLLSGKQIVSTNCLTTDQIKRIASLYQTEESRLDLAIYAYPYILDKGSYFKMNSLFEKEASIDALNKAILGE